MILKALYFFVFMMVGTWLWYVTRDISAVWLDHTYEDEVRHAIANNVHLKRNSDCFMVAGTISGAPLVAGSREELVTFTGHDGNSYITTSRTWSHFHTSGRPHRASGVVWRGRLTDISDGSMYFHTADSPSYHGRGMMILLLDPALAEMMLTVVFCLGMTVEFRRRIMVGELKRVT